jgi:ElaB/YqjD/DUF883 family membrane-anchored ribosome-binding protein
MAKKKSQIEKAIEQLESEIAVLQAARERLLDQQASAAARKQFERDGSKRYEPGSS